MPRGAYVRDWCERDESNTYRVRRVEPRRLRSRGRGARAPAAYRTAPPLVQIRIGSRVVIRCDTWSFQGCRQGIQNRPRVDNLDFFDRSGGRKSSSQSKLPNATCPSLPSRQAPHSRRPSKRPQVDETAASRSVDLYHARPRPLDTADARPDKADASGVLTCSHSPSLIFTTPRVDRGE